MESVSLFGKAQTYQNRTSSNMSVLSSHLTTNSPKHDEIVFTGKDAKAQQATKKGIIATAIIMIAVKLLTLAGVNPSETAKYTKEKQNVQTVKEQENNKHNDDRKKVNTDDKDYDWIGLDDVF